MKTYGLELEFFVKKDGKFIITPIDLYPDACGYLAEARGEPHNNPRSAIHLMRAAIEELHRKAKKMGAQLLLADTAPLDREFLRTTRRQFGKGPAKSFFAHGGAYKSESPRAGLHVHFGKQEEYGKTKAAVIQNIPRIIWLLDQAFAKAIRAAKRIPGEYELKGYGFEYRSLPATTDLNKLADVLVAISEEWMD